MSIKEAVKGITKILCMYLSVPLFKKYTGKIIIEINCRAGGIGSFNVSTVQSYNQKDLKNDTMEDK